MDRDARGYLWDIQEAALAIGRFTAGMDSSGFANNEVVRAAVERKFEIVGEALNQLSKIDPALARRVPDFCEIISFRNLLIHGYAVVDQDEVWDAVETSLPELRKAQGDRIWLTEERHPRKNRHPRACPEDRPRHCR